jgi:hypothetical protein
MTCILATFMSLGIVYKGPEGIVLAADSRITLTQTGQPDLNGYRTISHATYDNATKLFHINGHNHVGVVTFGLAAIQTSEGPRAPHSYLPEFENELGQERLTVEAYALKISDFFVKQLAGASNVADMQFYVCGYDTDGAYGRTFTLSIPSAPKPNEEHPGNFGIQWGGQEAIVSRILNGMDAHAMKIALEAMKLDQPAIDKLLGMLKLQLRLPIPWQALPLQDAVDLCMALVQSTVSFQGWATSLRGVGGPVDVATITRRDGFRYVQKKEVKVRQ